MMGAMPPLDEIAPGLWRFTAARNGLPPTMTAYALRDGEDTILIDPLARADDEQLLTALDRIAGGRVRILVTTPFHVRGSELLWRRWRDRHQVAIFGHEHCATRLEDRSGSTLEPLARPDVERVLVTHGEPALRDGARQLAASLARPPWRRASLY
jgi:glyoxylase-like metal-dependent hydrolase (beta-lactamase superfamily II)